jgi:N-[(2S)-2-amino-2-carboxyethyl]-L-glutamate dehydrogenase
MNLQLSKKSPNLLYLSKSDIITLGGNTSCLYIEAVKSALIRHAKQEFVQPLKPYLRWRGKENHIADRIIAMPAYIGGENSSVGLKWVGSKHDNPTENGLERASALIILNDPETHYPIAVMEGSLISGMRTAAVTALAAFYLAPKNFSCVSCIGCGPIAKMQLQTILEQFSSVKRVYLFDLNLKASESLIAQLRHQFPDIEYNNTSNPEEAVRSGEVVITCTVADSPYIPFEWLKKGSFVSNVSIMDFHKEAFLKVDKVVVDDWEQSNREKKIINQLVTESLFSREQLHAELGEIIVGDRPGRESDEEIILLNPMGMAIEDIACAQEIYQKAMVSNVGTLLSLN